MNIKIFIFSEILTLVCGLIIGWLIKPAHNEFSKTGIRVDSVLVIKYPEPVKLNRAKGKKEITSDSVITTNPFRSSIDTVIKRDSVFIEYLFPQNEFNLDIKKAPDTTYKEIITTEREPDIMFSFWTFLLGVLLGIIAGLSAE